MSAELPSKTAHDADPRTVLGVALDAPEAAIREAYLAKVKECPPDRDPAGFERVRDAYESLRDPRRRARLALIDVDPLPPLVSVLEGFKVTRPFLGPEPWRRLLSQAPTP